MAKIPGKVAADAELRAYHKAWRAEHVKARRAQALAYREKNRKAIAAAYREYYRKNRLAILARQKARKAELRGEVPKL